MEAMEAMEAMHAGTRPGECQFGNQNEHLDAYTGKP